jgi:AcrR family transcriptional regulator
MEVDSRKRMVRSAAALFRERGLSGTSFRDVVAHSGAPRGSIYHHFPGGKAQLAQEAVDWAGDVIAREIEGAARDGDPVAMLRGFAASWHEVLDESDFRAGCPIVAVAAEAQDDYPALADATAIVFLRWQAGFAEALRAAGVAPARAASLATLVVASIEGAIVLCRAQRETGPLDEVVDELEIAVRAAA